MEKGGKTEAVEKERVYSYVIISRLHSDAPAEWKRKLKRLLEDAPHELSQFSKQLAARTGMPLLRRVEGGVGGDNNATDKQIRLETKRAPWLNFSELCANVLNPGSNAWSLSEAKAVRSLFEEAL